MSETNPPNPESSNPVPPAPKPETFSREYVQELRAENAQWRTKAQGHAAAEQAAKEAADRATQEAKDAAERASKDAADRAAAAEQRANERVIQAELRTVAIKAGMVDLDALKILDLASVKLTDDGAVEGADELIEEAKKAKPYLFGAKTTTSSTTPPPSPKPPAPKSAKDMNDEEFEQAMRQKSWRR